MSVKSSSRMRTPVSTAFSFTRLPYTNHRSSYTIPYTPPPPPKRKHVFRIRRADSSQRVYIPRAVDKHTAIDPLLAYRGRSKPLLEFDITLPTSQILISDQPSKTAYELSTYHLSQPATTPPIPDIRITCPNSAFHWPIDIYASPSRGGGYVTVGNILEGIHISLRRHVSKADWNALSVDAQRRVRSAWIQRYKRQNSFRERAYEESQGLRRMDFLMMDVQFLGLSPGKSHDHWVMHVKPMERSVKFRNGS